MRGSGPAPVLLLPGELLIPRRAPSSQESCTNPVGDPPGPTRPPLGAGAGGPSWPLSFSPWGPLRKVDEGAASWREVGGSRSIPPFPATLCPRSPRVAESHPVPGSRTALVLHAEGARMEGPQPEACGGHPGGNWNRPQQGPLGLRGTESGRCPQLPRPLFILSVC